MRVEYLQFTAASAAEWRAFLEAEHATSSGVWLVTFKKGKGPYFPFGDAVDEALCFGWVDSQVRGLDEQRTQHLMTPRRAGSAWSAVNKEKIARLTADGLMAPAGLAAVERAKADGTWHALDAVEQLTVPPDLAAALNAVPAARAAFDAFPRSATRAILEWISSARTDATRARRIDETVSEASAGRRANQWRQPQGR